MMESVWVSKASVIRFGLSQSSQGKFLAENQKRLNGLKAWATVYQGDERGSEWQNSSSQRKQKKMKLVLEVNSYFPQRTFYVNFPLPKTYTGEEGVVCMAWGPSNSQVRLMGRREYQKQPVRTGESTPVACTVIKNTTMMIHKVKLLHTLLPVCTNRSISLCLHHYLATGGMNSRLHTCQESTLHPHPTETFK